MLDIAKLIRETTFVEHCPTCDSKLVPEGENTLKCPAHLRIFVLCASCYRIAVNGSPDQKHCHLCYKIIQLEQAKAEAFQAGRKAGYAEGVKNTIEAIKSTDLDADNAEKLHVYTALEYKVMRVMRDKLEALAGGGE